MVTPASPEAVAQVFVAAINSGDLDSALDLWVDDAVCVPAGAAPAAGKQAVRGVLAALIDNGTKLTIETSRTYIAGATAVRTGRLKLSGRGAGEEPFEVRTDYVTVYAFGDAGWRIAIDAPAGLSGA
jgi:ketosteroid isomerase-like protein